MIYVYGFVVILLSMSSLLFVFREPSKFWFCFTLGVACWVQYDIITALVTYANS